MPADLNQIEQLMRLYAPFSPEAKLRQATAASKLQDQMLRNQFNEQDMPTQLGQSQANLEATRSRTGLAQNQDRRAETMQPYAIEQLQAITDSTRSGTKRADAAFPLQQALTKLGIKESQFNLQNAPEREKRLIEQHQNAMKTAEMSRQNIGGITASTVLAALREAAASPAVGGPDMQQTAAALMQRLFPGQNIPIPANSAGLFGQQSRAAEQQAAQALVQQLLDAINKQ